MDSGPVLRLDMMEPFFVHFLDGPVYITRDPLDDENHGIEKLQKNGKKFNLGFLHSF